MISTIYSKKVMSDAIDEICETDPQHLPEFVEDSIIQSYGVGPLTLALAHTLTHPHSPSP